MNKNQKLRTLRSLALRTGTTMCRINEAGMEAAAAKLDANPRMTVQELLDSVSNLVIHIIPTI